MIVNIQSPVILVLLLINCLHSNPYLASNNAPTYAAADRPSREKYSILQKLKKLSASDKNDQDSESAIISVQYTDKKGRLQTLKAKALLPVSCCKDSKQSPMSKGQTISGSCRQTVDKEKASTF